jgi:hypothetical protein
LLLNARRYPLDSVVGTFLMSRNAALQRIRAGALDLL